MEVPEFDDAAVPTVSGQQGPTVLAPVEALQIVAVEHILRLVDAQVIHFDHLVRDRRVPILVKRVKFYAENALVALFFNLRLR